MSYAASDAALTAMKKDPELAWLNEVSSVPLQQALRHQYKAFSSVLRRACPVPEVQVPATAASPRPTPGRRSPCAAACCGWPRPAPRCAFVWSWPDVDVTTLNPTTVTVSRDPDGRWYVSFAVDVADPEQLPADGRVGRRGPGHQGLRGDLGRREDPQPPAAGQAGTGPRPVSAAGSPAARRGSANRAKAKAKVARAHRKVRASRADFLHRASTRLVRDHDVIVVEDLAVRNMPQPKPKPDPQRPGKYLPNGAAAKTGLNKAISDVGWGEFRRQLEYKTSKYGTAADRDRPLVSLQQDLLGVRAPARFAEPGAPGHWTCPSCGTRHDRDINAAKNIAAAGRAVAGGNPGDACGADVRRQGNPLPRSAVKQEPSGVSPGIPVLQGGE